MNRIKKTTPILLLVTMCFLFPCIQTSIGTPINDTKLTPIPDELISIIAEQKLIELGKTSTYRLTEDTIPITTEQGTPLCTLLLLDPCGYIVVAAYYELSPVIAYSFTHQPLTDKSMNHPFFTLLSTDISHRLDALNILPYQTLLEQKSNTISFIQGDSKDTRFQQWPPEGTTPTEGWIETTWTQNPPYNDFCPMDQGSGQRSLAGCPAVTMAQILNYHRTTNDITFTDADDYYHNYGGNQYWIDDDYVEYQFPSFPQLNTYLTTLTSHYTSGTPLTDADKAALTFACGVAAEQVYNSGGSGTFGVDQAYDAYQRFDFSYIELLDESDPDLYTRLIDNIQNAYPAHFAIVNEEWTSGHNLVIDGYNTDDYYHLNFGWGGSYDGWYIIPDELPYSLTVIEGIILDIIPEPVNESFDINQNSQDRGFPVRHALDGDWGAAQSFIPTVEQITQADIYLRKFGTPEFDLIVELREDNPEGNLIETLIFTPAEVPANWEWHPLNFTDITVIPDTTYFIVLPPAPSGVTTSFGYEWGYAFGNHYNDGAFWFTRDGGGLWRDLPTMYEFTFRTYA